MLPVQLLQQFNTFGPTLIFIVMVLEGLNLTGIPAIVILPTVGFFVGNSTLSFGFVCSITIIGSMIGNLIYYIIAYKFGSIIFDFFYNKFPRTQKSLQKTLNLTQSFGPLACLFGRLLPAVRTFISLISGVFKVHPKDFILYSCVGITIWNTILFSVGYFLSLLEI